MLINIVFRVDVDIFMSWDMEKKGIRYLVQRGIENGINISACLSRTNDLEDLFEHINFI
jgi:translation elongation factor EF-Ts